MGGVEKQKRAEVVVQEIHVISLSVLDCSARETVCREKKKKNSWNQNGEFFHSQNLQDFLKSYKWSESKWLESLKVFPGFEAA